MSRSTLPLLFLCVAILFFLSPVQARRNSTCKDRPTPDSYEACCTIGPDGGSCRFLHHALEILPGAFTTQSEVCLYLATAVSDVKTACSIQHLMVLLQQDPDYVYERFTQVVPLSVDEHGNITRELVLVQEEDEDYPAIGFSIEPAPSAGAFSRCLIRLVVFPNEGDDARLVSKNIYIDGSKASNRHQYTLADKDRVHMCFASSMGYSGVNSSSSSHHQKRNWWTSITKAVKSVGDDIVDVVDEIGGELCIDSLKITCSVAFTFLLGEEEAAMTLASVVAKETALTALANTIEAAICDLDSKMSDYECGELAELIVSFFTGGIMEAFISQMCYGLSYCICDLADGDFSDCEDYVNQLDLSKYIE